MPCAGGLPPRPAAPSRPRHDLGFIQANAGPAQKPAVTWIGHATVLVSSAALSLLTDPIFSERASPLSFIGPNASKPPGVALPDLPHIDLVLVSHNHYDHLDLPSCRAPRRAARWQPALHRAAGLGAWFQAEGMGARGGAGLVAITDRAGRVSKSCCCPPPLVRPRLTDRMQTLWGGFAVFAPNCQLFYAGDTGYSRDFVRIRERLVERQQSPTKAAASTSPSSLSSVYAPRWFMKDQHVNVEEALRIHTDPAPSARSACTLGHLRAHLTKRWTNPCVSWSACARSPG